MRLVGECASGSGRIVGSHVLSKDRKTYFVQKGFGGGGIGWGLGVRTIFRVTGNFLKKL